MLRQKGKKNGFALVRGVALSLLAEAAVVVVFGLLFGWMAARGWLKLEMVSGCGFAALALAGLLGGVVLCGAKRTMPLVWGLCAGMMLTAVCIVGGAIWRGGEMVLGLRLLAPVVGGAFAGVLMAVRK